MRSLRSCSYTLKRLPRSLALRFLVVLVLIWDSLQTISLYQHQQAVRGAPPPPRNTKRIYIAAQHWNSAHVLRSHWNAALSTLVQELGTDNVFVSIYESGSYDDTEGCESRRASYSRMYRMQTKSRSSQRNMGGSRRRQARPSCGAYHSWRRYGIEFLILSWLR
jgi:hypothetical protein